MLHTDSGFSLILIPAQSVVANDELLLLVELLVSLCSERQLLLYTIVVSNEEASGEKDLNRMDSVRRCASMIEKN